MPGTSDRTAIEHRIREEFAIAIAEREHASPDDKPHAEDCLNRAVRRLIDFIGHGKVPADLRQTSSGNPVSASYRAAEPSR